MDGVHDLGGFQGLGPVEGLSDDALFAADWERRVFRLTMAARFSGHLGGLHRYAVERIDPALYLNTPYFGRWLIGVATVLIETGAVTREELDARLGRPFVVARPSRGSWLSHPGESYDQHRFAIGDRVRVREWHPLGHTRAPGYVQGKGGTVVRLDGVYSLPDVELHCDSRRVEPTYSIRFEAAELWGTVGDPVHVDLWDSYLEASE